MQPPILTKICAAAKTLSRPTSFAQAVLSNIRLEAVHGPAQSARSKLKIQIAHESLRNKADAIQCAATNMAIRPERTS